MFSNFAVRFALITIILFFVGFRAHSQGMGKMDNPAYQAYFDSLKTMDYKYPLPILGKSAYKKGYDLPLAWGFSGVYFTQTQQISIDRTLIGFNGSELVDVSNIIKFGPTIATTNAYTVRPDVWIFPFFNLYGIFGVGTTETEVNLIEPVGFSTTQKFTVSSYGVGTTLSGAVGPVWLAWDNNYNFANIDVVVEPVPAFNSSLRVGHTLRFPYQPERSLSIWGGVFYQVIQNDTEGSIPLEDVFPNFGNDLIIDYLYEWAETLPPTQRVIVNQIIDKLDEITNGIDPGESTIEYKLDKRVTAPFNLIFGAQYQFNKNWMLRSELGVFGKRSQFLLNLNYRFSGFRKR